MRYVKAALAGLALALVAAMLVTGVSVDLEGVDPSLRATMLAAGISEFVACAISYSLIAVPLAILFTFVRGRIRARRPGGPADGGAARR